MKQIKALRKIKKAVLEPNPDDTVKRAAEKACDDLNTWHVRQLIIQLFPTILTIILACNFHEWSHWIFLELQLCVFFTQLIQMCYLNVQQGRPCYLTFELSHMVTNHYNVHWSLYIGFIVCTNVCFFGSCYLWVFIVVVACIVDECFFFVFSYYHEINKLYFYNQMQEALSRINFGGV